MGTIKRFHQVFFFIITIIFFTSSHSFAKTIDVACIQTKLMRAINRGDFEKVKLLIKKGADVTIKYDKGKTALDYAKAFGKSDIINLLKEAGAKE